MHAYMQIIGEPGLWRELSVFQEAHHPLGRVQYAPLRYARVCTCAHTHTGVHRQAAHLRSSHPLPPSTATRRCNVLRTGKIKCKYPDEFNQNSSAISGENSRRGTTRPTIRPVSRLFRPRKGWAVKPWPSNFGRKGFAFTVFRCAPLERKGENEGGSDRKKLRVDATMAFCQTNTTLWKTIPREPYTTSSPLHPPACPDVSLHPTCITSPPSDSLFLLALPSFFPIIVHLGQPFRRQFRLFFKDVHHFSGRVKSHSTTRALLCRFAGERLILISSLKSSALFENFLVSLLSRTSLPFFFSFFLFIFCTIRIFVFGFVIVHSA